MKLLALFVLAVSLLFAGCVSTANAKKMSETVQASLDAALPPDFRGDVALNLKVSGFGFTLHAGNVRRTVKGWTFDWLVWNRDGVWSRGSVVLGSPPKFLLP